jgi:hypothetical protein
MLYAQDASKLDFGSNSTREMSGMMASMALRVSSPGLSYTNRRSRSPKPRRRSQTLGMTPALIDLLDLKRRLDVQF